MNHIPYRNTRRVERLIHTKIIALHSVYLLYAIHIFTLDQQIQYSKNMKLYGIAYIHVVAHTFIMYPPTHQIVVYQDDFYYVFLYICTGENHFQMCVITSYAHQNFQYVQILNGCLCSCRVDLKHCNVHYVPMYCTTYIHLCSFKFNRDSWVGTLNEKSTFCP